MVLRRPYAFLIKHFRLIHLFITGLLAGIIFKSNLVYGFLNDCISDSVNKYNALEYIDYSIYIYIVVVILLMYVVSHLLKFKDKPRNIYLFSILCYVIIGIVMFVVYGYLSTLVNNVIDQKVIRLYRDVLSITMFTQLYVVIVMFIRGLGFDIKKFNFSKDAQELNLTNEDGEEVEVNVVVDTTDVMRGIRKQRREFGYFYQEYKLYIISIMIILLIFVGYNSYNYLNAKFKVYNQGDLVGYNNYLNIKNSYHSVVKDDSFIIVSFDIYKYGKNEQFNTGNMNLLVGDKKYSVNKNICYKFNSLGNCYKRQYITDDVTNYIVTFEVDEIDSKNVYVLYSESYDNSYKIKLNLEEY